MSLNSILNRTSTFLLTGLLVFCLVLGFSCRNQKEHQAEEPSSSPKIGPGDSLFEIYTSERQEKINIGGVVKNALAVSKGAPLLFQFQPDANSRELRLAIGVVPGSAKGPVRFTFQMGARTPETIEVNPDQEKEWKDHLSIPLEGSTTGALRTLTVECNLPEPGAYVAHPQLVNPGEPTDAEKPSLVVFILIDALRADALGVYGAKGNPSPHLDQLAKSGAVFTRAYTSSPFTMTSVASIFTGLFPWQHQVLFSEGAGLALSADLPNLVAEFRKAGYHTAAFSGTYFRFTSNGFAHGFDSFDETCAAAFFRDSADCLNRRILAWLPQHQGERVFLYVHYVDTHAPYYAPEPFRHRFISGLTKPWWNDVSLGEVAEFGSNRPWYQFYRRPSPNDLIWLRGLYQGEVAYADDRIGAFLEALKKIAPAEGPGPLLLVTADHGETFYEHGEVEHVADLHDPVMRVPLILAGPGVPAGKMIEAPVRTIDYMATLARRAGINIPTGIAGRSLAPLFQGESMPPAPAVALHYPQGQPEYALVLWPWKLFWRPDKNEARLFRLDRDPGEKNDLAKSNPEELKAMRDLLSRLLAQSRPGSDVQTPAVDAETMKKLKSLNYLGP